MLAGSLPSWFEPAESQSAMRSASVSSSMLYPLAPMLRQLPKVHQSSVNMPVKPMASRAVLVRSS